MNGYEMRNKLHKGEYVYGSMIVSESPRWPSAVSSIGLDFAFIDTEHIALDRTKISWMCRLYAGLGIVPVVRIPSPDPYQATMMFDAGAMEALGDILTVDGLDAVLIGPHDLSCNLGLPEQYFHPVFVEAVDEIITKAREAGIGAGIHVVSPDLMEQEIRWAKMGANLIIHSIDIIAFQAGLHKDIDTIKAALEEKSI